MPSRCHVRVIVITLVAILFLPFCRAHGQGTAFTYQGQLNAGGTPANGIYDFTFALYPTNTGGTLLAGPVTNMATMVSNGLFTSTIDFGNVFNGGASWLEISVQTNGGTNFAILAPRQLITPVPYAITASNVTGPLALSQLPAAVITNGAVGLNLTGSFSGNGAGFTNVPGSSITGALTNNTTGNAAIATNALSLQGISAGGFVQWQTNMSQLQASWAALPVFTNNLTVSSGGLLQLSNGIYPLPNQVFTNGGPTWQIIMGTGAGNTVLLDTNPSGDFLTFHGGAPGNMSPQFYNLCIAGTKDKTNYLVHVTGVGSPQFHNCLIGYWPSMTNNGGAGLNPDTAVDGNANDLCGVFIDGTLGGWTSMYDNSFQYLHQAILLNTDHVRIYDTWFGCDGFVNPPNNFEISDWPANSPQYWGTAFDFIGGLGDFTIFSTHHYNGSSLCVDSAINLEKPILWFDCENEDGEYILFNGQLTSSNLASIIFLDSNVGFYPPDNGEAIFYTNNNANLSSFVPNNFCAYAGEYHYGPALEGYWIDFPYLETFGSITNQGVYAGNGNGTEAAIQVAISNTTTMVTAYGHVTNGIITFTLSP